MDKTVFLSLFKYKNLLQTQEGHFLKNEISAQQVDQGRILSAQIINGPYRFFDFTNWSKWGEVTHMEFPWPQWMEFVILGGSTVVCVIALKILDRFHKLKE